MNRKQERAARRAALSGAGPTGEGRVGRLPGAVGGFALFGEVLMVGMLVTLVALPVVTLPVALAAGIRHLRRYLHAEDSRLVFFRRDLRAGLIGSLGVGAVAVVIAAVLAADIMLAASPALPGGPVVAAVGWGGLGLLGAAVLMVAAAWSPQGGWLAAARSTPAHLADDPRGAGYLVAAAVFVGVVTWALPPLLIAGLGCAALATVAVPERPARRR